MGYGARRIFYRNHAQGYVAEAEEIARDYEGRMDECVSEDLQYNYDVNGQPVPKDATAQFYHDDALAWAERYKAKAMIDAVDIEKDALEAAYMAIRRRIYGE